MAHPLAAFYNRKRVLVTGHTGFQGGWLVAWLKLLGAQICGFGLPPSTRPNFFDANILDRGISSIFADIRDRNALAHAFGEFQPEIVIHCAAQTNLESAHRDPVQTFATNAMGTVHVLEEARQTGSVRALVIATHPEKYGDVGWFWGHSKDDVFDASDTSSASFACAEIATSAYIESFFTKSKTAVATARCAKLIGGGDWAEGRLIPGIVRAINSSGEIVLDNSPAAAWLHVLDGARAYLLLGQKLYQDCQACSGAWNFAVAESDMMSAQQLVAAFVKHWGDPELNVESQSESSKKKPRSAKPAHRLDTSKSQTQLGWTPALPIKDAIAWTAEWYRNYYSDPASAWRVTDDQIGRYMRRK
jgi:CDP-glucose 4,6-dehydratase